MALYNDAAQLNDRALRAFDQMCALPDEEVPEDMRSRIFEQVHLVSHDVRHTLQTLIDTGKVCPKRVACIRTVIEMIDSLTIGTKRDALLFLTECLGLARLMEDVAAPREAAAANIPESVYGEMYDAQGRLTRALASMPRRVFTYDELHTIIYEQPMSPDNPSDARNKIAILVSRVNKLIRGYGRIEVARGQGYMLVPESPMEPPEAGN